MSDLLRSNLAFRLSAAHRRVDRYLNRLFDQLELTHAHAQLLACLLEADKAGRELRVADLAEQTGFEQSTVSRLIKELARRKLAKRRQHPDDRRSRLWQPAKRGKALRLEIETILRKANERLRRDLPDADFQGLLRSADVLDKLP